LGADQRQTQALPCEQLRCAYGRCARGTENAVAARDRGAHEEVVKEQRAEKGEEPRLKIEVKELMLCPEARKNFEQFLLAYGKASMRAGIVLTIKYVISGRTGFQAANILEDTGGGNRKKSARQRERRIR
jgi:hypothetical protein